MCVPLPSLNHVGRAVLNRYEYKTIFFVPNCCLGSDTADCVYLETELGTPNKGFSRFSFDVVERHVSKHF